jgi:hypothetical protein
VEATIDGGGEGGGRPRDPDSEKFSDAHRRRAGSGNCSMMSSASTSDEREGDGVRGNGADGLAIKNESYSVGCGCNISTGGWSCKSSRSSAVSLKFRLCTGGGAGGGNEGFRVSGTIEENGYSDSRKRGWKCYLGHGNLTLISRRNTSISGNTSSQISFPPPTTIVNRGRPRRGLRSWSGVLPSP